MVKKIDGLTITPNLQHFQVNIPRHKMAYPQTRGDFPNDPSAQNNSTFTCSPMVDKITALFSAIKAKAGAFFSGIWAAARSLIGRAHAQQPVLINTKAQEIELTIALIREPKEEDSQVVHHVVASEENFKPLIYTVVPEEMPLADFEERNGKNGFNPHLRIEIPAVDAVVHSVLGSNESPNASLAFHVRRTMPEGMSAIDFEERNAESSNIDL